MEKNYIVVNHEYYNTGGNCMVSAFTVYCKSDNVTRFMFINDESVTWAVADFVSSCLVEELDRDTYDNLILGSFTWEAITEQRLSKEGCIEEELLELMIDCRFEYMKKDCEYFREPANVTYDELPVRLMNTLSKECIEWHIENGQYFTTNCYEVGPSEFYRPEKPPVDKKLQQLKEYKQWFDSLIGPDATDEDLARLYNTKISVTVDGKTIDLEFYAESYNAVDDLLTRVIEDW